MKKVILLILLISVSVFSCKKEIAIDTIPDSKLIFKFKFDSTQQRLNNIGNPSTIPVGNAAQSPIMNKMGAHYIELAQTDFTALGAGAVLYKAEETSVGGEKAIDFEKSKFAANNEIFYEIPIKDIAPGEYKWLRTSLAYQNMDLTYRIDTTISGIPINQDVIGTIAGFIGFNSYIKNFTIKAKTETVNANKKQGFWGFETIFKILGVDNPYTSTGQAPANATTVVNPLFASSPIPAGSCVVTSKFNPGTLKITGKETKDIIIEASFSTNKSVEWKDFNANGKWDPLKGEPIVDMGIRGMVVSIK
jgi:hypothetical protein